MGVLKIDPKTGIFRDQRKGIVKLCNANTWRHKTSQLGPVPCQIIKSGWCLGWSESSVERLQREVRYLQESQNDTVLALRVSGYWSDYAIEYSHLKAHSQLRK